MDDTNRPLAFRAKAFRLKLLDTRDYESIT